MIKPIRDSIKAIQHSPEYTLHRYFARRPHNVINNIIHHYIPNDDGLVFDPFGGGGTMLYEALVLGNRAITCDTSDLACFVIEQEALMSNANVEKLSVFVNDMMANLAEVFGDVYKFKDKEVYWIEWSTYTSCPDCNERVLLTPYNTLGSGKYRCEKCGREFRPVGVQIDNTLPVEICLMAKGSLEKGVVQEQSRLRDENGNIQEFYDGVLEKIDKMGLGESIVPITPIPDCNLQRESALHKKGILFFEQFIPKASRAVISYMGNYIMQSSLPEEMKRKMVFVLSASLRYCSRFSCLNKAWRGDRPMEWAKSNFWTPYTYVEVNPIITFYERWQSYLTAVKSAKSKFEVGPNKGTCSEVINKEKDFAILNKSSGNVNEIPSNSIDLIVTDPPYGSYLHYGELSAFWTTWLSKFLPDISPVPNRDNEAVPARKKGYPGWKTFSQYEAILSDVFFEAYRVLKNESYCVVTFNNKEPEAWIAFLRAVKRAGFILPEDGIIFQDGVESYKKSIDSRRGGAIFGDFIYSFHKKDGSIPVINSRYNNWSENLDVNLYKLSKEFNVIDNVTLYTQVYLKLLPEMYEAIDPKCEETTYLEGMSFKNFENKIFEYYFFEDGLWIKK